MAWITKLEESDYTVERTPDRVVYKDHRNKRAYELKPWLIEEIRKMGGFDQPDAVWIRAAILHAWIPHPYEEYV